MDRTSKRARGKRTPVAASAHQPPSVKSLIPEIRSDLKWKPSQNPPAPFAVPNTAVFVLAVWNFGVPFSELEALRTWLATNEARLAGLLQSEMGKKGAADAKVFYLGTYLNIRNGSPMYQTFWGYTSEDGLENDTAWPNPFPPALRDLIVELRAFWTRDPGRSESRLGLASSYDLDPQRNQVLGKITHDAAKKARP